MDPESEVNKILKRRIRWLQKKKSDSDALSATLTLALVLANHVFLFHPSHVLPAGISSPVFCTTLNHFDQYHSQNSRKMLKAPIFREPMDPFK